MRRRLPLSVTASLLIYPHLLSGAEPPPKPAQKPAVAARTTQDLILDAILRLRSRFLTPAARRTASYSADARSTTCRNKKACSG